MSSVRELVVRLLLDASDFKAEAARSQEQLEGLKRVGKGVQSQTDATAKALSSAARESQKAWDGVSMDGSVASLERFGSVAQGAVAPLLEGLSRVSSTLRSLGEELDRATGDARRGFQAAGAAADSFGKETRQSGSEGAGAFKKAGDAAEKAGEQAKQAAQEGQSAWDNLKGTLLGFLSIGGAVGAAMDFTEQTQKISQYSQQLGMSVEKWQAWAGAASSLGIEAQDLYDTFRDMSDWTIDMVKNGGSGPFKDFSKQTGLSLKDAKGNMVGTEEALLRLADAAAKFKPEEASGWLTQMGVDPTNITLILKGRKAIEGYIKAAKEKVVYDREDIDNAGKLTGAWDVVHRIFQSVTADAIKMVAPSIERLTEKAEGFFKFMKENEDTVQRILVSIGAAISSVVIPKLVKMTAAAWASLGPYALIPAAIMAIGLVIDDLMVWLEGGQSALGGFFNLIFGNAENAKKFFGKVKDAVVEFIEIITTIPGIFMDAFSAIPEVVSNAFNAIKERVKGWIKALIDMLPDFVKDKILIKGEVEPEEEDETVAKSKEAAKGGKGPTFEKEKSEPIPEPEPDDYAASLDFVNASRKDPTLLQKSGLVQPSTGVAQAPAQQLPLSAKPGDTGTMPQALGQGGAFGAGQAAAKGANINTTNNNQRTITQTNNINITTNSDNPQAIASDVGNTINPKTLATESDTSIGV